MTSFVFSAVAGRPHHSYLDYLGRWLPQAAARVTRPPKEVAISLLGATRMAALHHEFLQVNSPTDVLTFEHAHSADGRCLEGEVVLCVPYARKAAQRHGTAIERELLLYALHGLLHLSGFDDLTPEDFQEMHAEEDKILTAIGVGPVFGAVLPTKNRRPR